MTCSVSTKHQFTNGCQIAHRSTTSGHLFHDTQPTCEMAIASPHTIRAWTGPSSSLIAWKNIPHSQTRHAQKVVLLCRSELICCAKSCSFAFVHWGGGVLPLPHSSIIPQSNSLYVSPLALETIMSGVCWAITCSHSEMQNNGHPVPISVPAL